MIDINFSQLLQAVALLWNKYEFIMKLLIALTVLLAILQIVFASSISKLATGKASGFYAPLGSFAAQIAAVGDPAAPSTTYWNSGGFAPQYLELEFPCFYTVDNIFLQVEQTPIVGHTIHKIYAGPTSNSTNLIATLDSTTNNGQWIHINFSPPLSNVRFVRINTVESPSWVAWRKFLLF